MTQPLSVDPESVRSLGEVHQRVAGELGSLAAAAPGAGAVAQSHGTIAAAVDAALTGALGARSDTMATTRGAGDTISELLRQAALAYERGDDRGAEAIRTAADHLARDESDGVAGTSAAVAPPGGADALGQAVGQLSQLGQLGQQLMTPFAALAQPLAQLPQLLAQGLAQAGQGVDRTEDPEIPDVPDVPDVSEVADAEDADDPDDDRDDERDPDDESPAAADAGPRVGDGGPPGTDPVPPPATPRPAPTRPAVG